MPKDTGNIRYLKTAGGSSTPASPPSSNFDDLVQRLEARIDQISQIEKDLKETLHRVEGRAHPSTIEKAKGELSSLIHNLEAKIQKVSEEIRAGRGVKGLLSLDRFKTSLASLWMGEESDSYEFDEFGMDPVFSKKAKPFFDFLYYNYWRVSVKGVKNIPGDGRGLIVANHSGTLPYDGAMIRLAVENDHPSRRDVRFLVEDFVYHFPFLGTFMYRIGGVRACPENAERLLTKDHLVTVFPEGIKGIGKHYKNRYRLQRFGRGGFIKLALKTNSPLIPTAVIGAEEIHPLIFKSTILARPLGIPYIPITPTLPWLGPLGLIPLPSKWTIVFGEPIQFSPKYGPKDAEDQLLINRLSEMVRGKIQDMILEALKQRRSVWFG